MKNVINIFALCLILLISCKQKDGLKSIKELKVPDKYAFVGDSSNSADLSWRQYFADTLLVNLIEEAISNNKDMMMALQKMDAAGSNIISARGALLPNLNANTTFNERRFGLYTMDGAGNISTYILPNEIVPINLPDYYLGVQSSWEVDIRGRLRNKKKAAMARYLESVEGKNWVMTNLIADVATGYYELLALDNELDVIKETIALQENAVEVVTTLKQAAAGNELAVKQFKGQLLRSKALEYQVKQQIVEWENRINFLLGRFPQTVVRDKNKILVQEPYVYKIGLPSDLLKNRPDVRLAEYELLASKADFKAAKAAFYPSFNINSAVGFQSFRTSFLFSSPESIAYNLLGGLVAPVLNRSAIKAEFKYANAKQCEVMYDYQKVILNAYVDVYNQSSKIKNLESELGYKTEQVENQKEAVDISLDLFKTGQATYLEVLMAQKNALESKLDLMNTRKQQLCAFVNLYKALGGGWK